MARVLRLAVAIFISALALTGCGKSLLEEASLLPEGIEPIGYVPVGEDLVNVVFDDGSKVEVEYDFRLEAQDTIKVSGTEPIAPAEELAKQAADSLSFAYNYGINNVVKASIVVEYRYNGTDYQLNCLEPELLTVNGSHSTKEEVTSPAYYELSETEYVLDFSGIELTSATQIFEVEEGYVPPTVEKIEWWAEHIAFRREAQMQGELVNIFCDNLFWAAERMTDGTLRNEVSSEYVGINTFEASVPELIKVENVAEVSDSTFIFEDGVADICGYEMAFIPSAWEIEGEVTYDGIDFASELDTCYIYPQSVTFYSADSAVVRFYNENPEDYAELSLSILVVEKENPLDHIEWGTRHESYAREAAYADGVAIATCNNLFSAVQIMTNGERQNAEEIPYNCNIKLSVSAPKKAVVASVANEIGKSYAFVGNEVTIGNAVISIETLSSSVEGKVVYQGKDYASEITPCGIKPWMATVTSANTVLIKLYNGNDEDYAEFEINLELEEEVIPPTVVDVILQPEHVAFRREATVAGTVLTVVCDNVANFADIYSDGSKQNEEEVPYTVSNKFNFNAPAMKVDELSTVVGKTFSFENGVVTVANQTVSAVWVSAAVDGKVMHNGQDYASEITPCKVSARTITFVSASEAVIKFYDNNANDYAEATVEVNVSEKEAQFERVEWSYDHKAFRREASVANGIITVVCDNIANFADIYSDGSRQNEEDVDYTVSNKFAFNAPAMKVDELSTVVGRTFSFNNGVVTVAGQTVSAVWKSAAVDGKVMHNGKDYASEIVPCKIEAKTITFVSASEAVIRFYDNNANDYAEATVTVTVEEQATVVDVASSYAHIAFNQNAVVANNTISVICDNKATQTKTWSNGTKDETSVDYTVTNRFVYTMSRMPVSVKGQTFRFNAGTAVVEGRNVNVNFSSREVSAIIFDGVDYRSEAPVCEVNVATITFGEGTATITFEKGNETIVAAVPVDYLEGEVIGGEIVGAWITDSYQGRTYVSTDLHILAKQADGSYVAYSRNVNETSFTTTALTASEGQGVLSSGRAMAWAKPGTLGTVSSVKSGKTSTGYVIMYYYLNGNGANVLGDAEAALNGVPFAEPVKAIGAVADGMWSITYNGTTYYFVSK